MEDAPSPDSPQSLPGYESPFTAIRNRRAIADLLQRLIAIRAVVHVLLAADGRRYVSSMLALGRKAQDFYLDELNSPDGAVALSPNQRIRIIASLNSAILSFTTKVAAVGEKGGIAWYRLHRPEVISYRQRRKAYRLPVDTRYSISVALEEGDQRLLCGLHDISSDGLSLTIEGSVPPAVERLQRFSRCTVHFPNHESIRCGLEVRNVRAASDVQGYIVGGRFVTADRRSSAQLSKTITRFERYTIRRKRGR